MNLDDLLNEMSEKMRNRDLSDEYLREHNNSTREEIGIGEYAYGITMIPCEWIYKYLSDYKRVLKENEILKEEKEQAWEEWNNLEQGSYGTEQKLKQQIKELKKENEELKEERQIVGIPVRNKRDRRIGIVLHQWESGSVAVLESINPRVINTHDSWNTLEIVTDEVKQTPPPEPQLPTKTICESFLKKVRNK